MSCLIYVNDTFRIEGSGGLRKPLQLGCDCQLLKAFVCMVFCCFKGYTLKSPADHTARSPRKPKYIYCKLPHISVCLFVCFVALRPKSTAMVIAGRSAHLTTLFPGQA